jgi:hypothetical protein
VLDQHSEVGDHLGQIYEKMGDKQDAARLYALAIVAPHKVPEAEQHLKSLLPDSKQDQKEIDRAREQLAAMRSVSLPWTGAKSASAEFFLTFVAPANPGPASIKAEQVKFISGDESLRPYAEKLQAQDFNIDFPDQTPIKLIRRGTLSCSDSSHQCQFVLKLPEDVRTID